MPIHSTLRRTIAAASLLSLAALVGTACDDAASGTASAPADSSTATAASSVEEACVATINQYRATLALAPLSAWTDSAGCFATQASLDFTAGTGHANFGKCGESAQNTCPGWPSDTTLASRLAVLRQCAKQMWDEGPGADVSAHGHYLNMSSISYRSVGCGTHQAGGRLWINMDFR